MLLIASLGLAACSGVRYADAPPLAFEDVDYGFSTERALEAPQIAYIDEGQGEQTILLVHGLASNAGFWRYAIPHLVQGDYRVIAVDLPGFWKSDKGAYPYDMTFYANTLSRFIQALGSRPRDLRRPLDGWPDRDHARPGAPRTDRPPRAGGASGDRSLSGRRGRLAGERSDGGRHHPCVRGVDPRQPRAELLPLGSGVGVEGRGARSGGQDLGDGGLLLRRPSLRPRYDRRAYYRTTTRGDGAHAHRVRGVRLVYGDYDRLIPNQYLHPGFPENVFRTGADAIPNAQLVEISHAGHMLQIERPEAFAEAVLDYLRSEGVTG